MKPVSRVSVAARQGSVNVFFFFKQKTAYEIKECDWFRRVLFRSLYVAGVTEATDARDNYTADQLVEAGFVSVDLPLGKRLRGNVGLRREFIAQNAASHDLFNPRIVVSQGHTRTTDWLTGANFTYSLAEKLNLRAAASRTLNRPDMDDLSPLPALDFVGEKIRIGNPSLRRALVTNYDLRLEAFPGLGEVFAGGVFYKRLVDVFAGG